jgi:hypothetical protein
MCDCYCEEMDEVEETEPVPQIAPLQVVKAKRK